VVGGTLAAATFGSIARSQGEPFKFGLTPVFLSNDLELLGHLRNYLVSRLGGASGLLPARSTIRTGP
jgi:phosphonate transport system substrate-binding protein